jgi:hypothetical protein
MKFHFKNILLAGTVMLTMLLSCNKDTSTRNVNTCNVANPAEDLPWLKTRIGNLVISDPNTIRYQYVQQADYNGETVFIFGNCDPMALSLFPVYTCTGAFLGNVGTVPATSLLNKKTLWKSQDSLCTGL